MSEALPIKTVDEALKALESRGNARVRELNIQRGAPENQFGVNMSDIRVMAKSIKSNHELGRELWASGNGEAMLLATLIMKPKQVSEDELEGMVTSVTPTYWQLADWLMTRLIKQHPGKEAMRLQWMEQAHPMLARAGWSLTAERIVKSPEGLDLGALLDRIEREMADAPAPAQWTMNFCLAEIGIHFAEHRQRATDIGERLGIYRDYPCSKGCTSPFAPTWIAAMVARQA